MIQSDNKPELEHSEEASGEEALARLRAKNRRSFRRRMALVVLAISIAAGFEWRREIAVWGLGRWQLLGSGGDSIGVRGAIQAVYGENALIVDVRGPDEFSMSHWAGARSLPLEIIESSGWPSDWPTNRPVVVYCTIGERSGKAAACLQKQGINASGVIGGIMALAKADEPLENENGLTFRVSVGPWNYGWMLPASYEAVKGHVSGFEP